MADTSDGQVQLRVSQSASGEIVASIDFVNNTDHVLLIEKIAGCLDGKIEADVFRITDASGAVIPFSLPLRKKLSGHAVEVVSLEPGHTLSTAVFLEQAYDFPSGEQNFKLMYNAVHATKTGKLVELVAESFATLSVRQRKTLGPELPRTARGLNKAEKEQVEQALAGAKELLRARIAQLTEWESASKESRAQFEAWFASGDEMTRSKVQNALQKALELAATLSSEHFAASTVDFQGQKKVAAEFYEAKRKILLYPVYFDRPDIGISSKPGIIAHELFHFEEVIKAKDVRYGPDDCKKLAKDLPDLAVENADNFELYLEGAD